MPNWVTNNLQVLGDEKELKKFAKKVKPMAFLNSFIPTPKELEKTESPNREKSTKKLNLKMKYGDDNWYDWHIANWGTKWDIEINVDDDNEYEKNYSFDSAWSPPTKGIETISKSYPKLTFFLSYEEGGMGFKGLAKIQNGKTEDACFNY